MYCQNKNVPLGSNFDLVKGKNKILAGAFQKTFHDVDTRTKFGSTWLLIHGYWSSVTILIFTNRSIWANTKWGTKLNSTSTGWGAFVPWLCHPFIRCSNNDSNDTTYVSQMQWAQNKMIKANREEQSSLISEKKNWY